MLKDIKERIENTSDLEELNRLKKEIARSGKYRALALGAELVTKITHKDVLFVKTVKSMFDEQKEKLKQGHGKTTRF